MKGSKGRDMKRALVLVLALLVAASFTSVTAQVKAKDGFYFAEQTTYPSSGWRYQVVIEVKGGKIVKATWNGINNKGLPDKITEASAGRYGMKKVSKLGKEWHEQAATVEEFLIKTQDVGFAKFTTPEGNTDAIAGASIHVKEYFDLVKEALAKPAVAKGMYKKDGWFYAKAPAFDKSGYAATALVTIVNGRIVSVQWNALHKAGGDSKLVRAEKGTYKMNAKLGEWNVQALKAEEALIKEQDPAKINVKADGHTDAISGVSVTVGEFLTVAAEALKGAK